jgi:hypothetical protein
VTRAASPCGPPLKDLFGLAQSPPNPAVRGGTFDRGHGIHDPGAAGGDRAGSLASARRDPATCSARRSPAAREHVVAADRLLDDVWSDDPPAIGLTRSPGYVLVTGHGELDLQRFDRLVAEARTGDAAAAATKLREALLLWRGPPLADFAYASFAQAEIGRLEELRLSARAHGTRLRQDAAHARRRGRP